MQVHHGRAKTDQGERVLAGRAKVVAPAKVLLPERRSSSLLDAFT